MFVKKIPQSTGWKEWENLSVFKRFPYLKRRCSQCCFDFPTCHSLSRLSWTFYNVICDLLFEKQKSWQFQKSAALSIIKAESPRLGVKRGGLVVRQCKVRALDCHNSLVTFNEISKGEVWRYCSGRHRQTVLLKQYCMHGIAHNLAGPKKEISSKSPLIFVECEWQQLRWWVDMYRCI